MKPDRVALGVPYYEGVLAGHHEKEFGYTIRRQQGTDDWLLIATIAGIGRFGTSIGEVKARPGSLTLLSPGTPHDYGTEKGADAWEILWVHFHPQLEWMDLLHWPIIAPGVATLELASSEYWVQVKAQFREVCRLSITPGPRRIQFTMNAMERLLLDCEALIPTAGITLDQRVLDAIQHIHANLSTSLNLATLSSQVHLSPSRFAHLFRAETGMAPLQYINVQRMNRAGILLERTTLGISEIASQVGMEPFHFSARFKEHTGINPRNFRTARSTRADR